jgi:hypothetical protein
MADSLSANTICIALILLKTFPQLKDSAQSESAIADRMLSDLLNVMNVRSAAAAKPGVTWTRSAATETRP